MTPAAPVFAKPIIAEQHSVKTASVPKITHISDEIWKVQEQHNLNFQVKYHCHWADFQTTGLVTGNRLQMDRWMWSPNEVFFILFHKERLKGCSYLRCGDLYYIHVCVQFLYKHLTKVNQQTQWTWWQLFVSQNMLFHFSVFQWNNGVIKTILSHNNNIHWYAVSQVQCQSISHIILQCLAPNCRNNKNQKNVRKGHLNN